MLQCERLGAELDELLELAGGQVVHRDTGVDALHTLRRNINLIQRVIHRHVGGANLNGGVLTLSLDGLLNLEGLGVHDEELATGTLGNVQLTAVQEQVHAHVASTAVGCAFELNLLNLLGLQVDCGDEEAAGDERLTGLVVNQNGAGVLDPIRVAFLHALVSPDELEGLLVVHCHGVVDSVGDPNGAVHVINGHAVRGGVTVLALVVLLHGQFGECLGLQGICIHACQGGSEAAARTHGGYEQLVVLLGVADLELAGQTLNDVCNATVCVHGAVCLGGGGGRVGCLGLGGGCRVALELAGFGGDLLDLGVVACGCGDLELQDGVRLNVGGLGGNLVALLVLRRLAGHLVGGADGAGSAVEDVGHGCGCASLLVHSNNGAVGQHDQVVCLAAVHGDLGDQLVCCTAVNHADLAGAEVRDVHQVVRLIVIERERLGAEGDELLELVGGRIVHGYTGVLALHALRRDVNFVLRVVNSHVGGANLAVLIALHRDGLLDLEGLGVDHEEFAAGAFGHVQLTAVHQNVHADVAGTAIGCALKLNLLDLLGLQIDSRDKEATGHESLTRLVINTHLAGVLDPVRVVLAQTRIGPQLLHGRLIVHGNGVIAGAGHPHGTFLVIDGDTVRTLVGVARVPLDNGQLGDSLNLQGVCVNASNRRNVLVAVSGARNPNLVGLLGVCDLELAGQALGDLCHRLVGDGASVAALACCPGGFCRERCGDGGNAGNCQCQRSNGEALECLARSEVHMYVLFRGWCVEVLLSPTDGW